MRTVVSRYDIVSTYGGGAPVVDAYTRLGARACVPIDNAVDPEAHHPVMARDEWRCHLLGVPTSRLRAGREAAE